MNKRISENNWMCVLFILIFIAIGFISVGLFKSSTTIFTKIPSVFLFIICLLAIRMIVIDTKKLNKDEQTKRKYV